MTILTAPIGRHDWQVSDDLLCVLNQSGSLN
jgi:hypothetical protein